MNLAEGVLIGVGVFLRVFTITCISLEIIGRQVRGKGLAAQLV